MKHGLTATVVDPGLDPGTPEVEADTTGRDWLLRQVERVRAQVDRAGQVEGRLRDLAAWRADSLWDEDRRLDAEELGADLRREPGRAVARLRQTPQGCDWLMERWRLLARAIEADGIWTEDQARLAFDLLGTPEVGRVGPPGGPGRAPLDLARAAIAELEGLRPDVDEADELHQALAAHDLRDTPTPELARLRRYETALHRRLRWLLDELRRPDLVAAPRPADPTCGSAVEAQVAVPAESIPLDETKRDAGETKASPGQNARPSTSPDVAMAREPRPDLARFSRRERRKRRRDRRSA